MVVNDQGSVVIFTPEGDFEYEWMMLNLETESWQWQGRSLVVDHRPAQDLVDLIQHEGFVIERE
jgi:hypothetical protein